MARGRFIIRTVFYLLTALVALVATGLIALQTPWARDSPRALAERRASAALNAQVSIGELKGSLLFGAGVEDLAIIRGRERVAAIEQVVVDYDAFDFLRGQFDVERIVVERPVLQAGARRTWFTLAIQRFRLVRHALQENHLRASTVGPIGNRDRRPS